MENKKYEFVQRIKSHYVGDECIQIMIPHQLNSGVTLLNSEGITYHYKPNSNLFVNKYTSDKRKDQFPYSQIPNHKSRIGLKTLEYVNQLLDFNRVYIKIADGIIEENYVVKDGTEALLATKYILPNKEEPQYMTRDNVLELLKKTNGDILSSNGEYKEEYTIPTEERLLEWYKEEIVKRRKSEQGYYQGNNTDKQVSEFFFRSVKKMTIDDVPSDIIVFNDAFLVSIKNNEIESVKAIIVKFISTDNYNYQ